MTLWFWRKVLMYVSDLVLKLPYDTHIGPESPDPPPSVLLDRLLTVRLLHKYYLWSLRRETKQSGTSTPQSKLAWYCTKYYRVWISYELQQLSKCYMPRNARGNLSVRIELNSRFGFIWACKHVFPPISWLYLYKQNQKSKLDTFSKIIHNFFR